MKIEVFGQPGTKVRLDGQEYELIRSGVWQATSNQFAVWRSTCAEPGCAEPIECFTAFGSLMLTRRCPAHAKPGAPISPGSAGAESLSVRTMNVGSRATTPKARHVECFDLSLRSVDEEPV